MKPSYEAMRENSRSVSFPTIQSWFEWLEANGWTAEEYRLATEAYRLPGGTPHPPCARCHKFHDTLEIALACVNKWK